MEQEFEHTIEGQEVSQDDINLIARSAAHADDNVLAELLRVPAYDGYIAKRVIPAGLAGHNPNDITLDHKPLIATSAATDAKIKIRPFRAIIGTRGSLDNKALWRDIRSAIYVGNGASTVVGEMQLPASAGQPRWDLIYARVDIDLGDAAVDRYVKLGENAVTTQPVVATKQTVVTIGRVAGVENATPVRPNIPPDSGSAYYIPLAYVRLASAHTLTSKVQATDIHECYQPAPIAPALGVMASRPADGCWLPDGNSIVTQGWSGPALPKPNTYVSPAVSGGDRLILPIAADDSYGYPASVPIGALKVLDRSRNWRKRTFLTRYQVVAGSNDGFPWMPTPGVGAALAWNARAPVYLSAGQSFVDDAAAFGAGVAGGLVLALNDIATPGPALPTGALLMVFVDYADGFLKCKRNNVALSKNLFLVIEADAPFVNMDTDGT